MKFVEKLLKISRKNQTLLCIGLDVNLDKVPPHILKSESPIFAFNKAIIDKTADLVCAFKPNMAFYEMLGAPGIEALKKTIEYVPDEIPVILDAKRGDIGGTASAYAKGIFEFFGADATTVNPFLGFDAVEPFLNYEDKGIFILCLTSNSGSADFQTSGSEPLYKSIAKHAAAWNKKGNCGVVVGATNPEEQLKEIREIVGNMPILIPGIGAQGGDLQSAIKYGTNKDRELAIINSSRAIIYASAKEDFADRAREEALKLRDEINKYRK
jgi:orotidine-5'-phosphate decarboxylase